MKFHGVEMIGPFILEKLNTLPAWAPQWVGRLIHQLSDDTIYFGAQGYWQSLGGGGSGSISNEPYDSVTWDGVINTGASKNVLRDKFVSIDDILDKLIPDSPPALSTISLQLLSTNYSARRSTGDNMVSIVAGALCVAVNWVLIPSPEVQSGEAFGDADEGTLTANVNGTDVGSKALTSVDDSGTYGSLVILTDKDYYDGQGAPTEGFWNALTAKVAPVSGGGVRVGENVYMLKHSVSGNASHNFVNDDPTPTIVSHTNTPFDMTSLTLKYISGVPSIQAGDVLKVGFSIVNAVTQCYNKDRVATLTSLYIASTVPFQFISPPSDGDTLIISSGMMTIADNVFSNLGLNVDLNGYSSYPVGIPAQTFNMTSIIRVDNVSPVEDAIFDNGSFTDQKFRTTSSSGAFPAIGLYGSTYPKIQDLTLNFELQLINGKVQWPEATNWATNVPQSGPNYIGIGGDNLGVVAGVEYRWYTRKLADVSNITSFTVDIEDSEGFGLVIDSEIIMYGIVESAIGWLDMNAAYPGTGNPSSDGDAALDISSSTPSRRRVTFGAIARSGALYVRIGIPGTSSKKFSSIKLNTTS